MSDKKKIILSLYYIRPLLVLLIILLFYSGGYMHLQILESMIRVMLILGFVGVSLLNNKNNKLVKEKENQFMVYLIFNISVIFFFLNLILIL